MTSKLEYKSRADIWVTSAIFCCKSDAQKYAIKLKKENDKNYRIKTCRISNLKFYVVHCSHKTSK